MRNRYRNMQRHICYKRTTTDPKCNIDVIDLQVTLQEVRRSPSSLKSTMDVLTQG